MDDAEKAAFFEQQFEDNRRALALAAEEHKFDASAYLKRSEAEQSPYSERGDAEAVRERTWAKLYQEAKSQLVSLEETHQELLNVYGNLEDEVRKLRAEREKQ
jgi:hypothetical protein